MAQNQDGDTAQKFGNTQLHHILMADKWPRFYSNSMGMQVTWNINITEENCHVLCSNSIGPLRTQTRSHRLVALLASQVESRLQFNYLADPGDYFLTLDDIDVCHSRPLDRKFLGMAVYYPSCPR